MARCSEQFTGRKLQRKALIWTASRVWTVIDATNESQAVSATPEPLNDPIPSVGNTHPLNSLLIVDSLDIVRAGLNAWTVTANYLIPSQDQGGGGGGLGAPATIEWGTLAETIQCDVDLDGKNIVNSVGVPFDPPLDREIIWDTLTIRQTEPYYDIIKARFFRGTVNSNPFILGPLNIAAGECLCESIAPDASYGFGATQVEMAYRFRFACNETTLNGELLDPFQWHIPDRGKDAYYLADNNEPALGPLFYKSGERVSQDVPLDSTGKPILASRTKVTEALRDAISPSGANAPVIVVSLSKPNIKLVKYCKRLARDFSTLGIITS